MRWKKGESITVENTHNRRNPPPGCHFWHTRGFNLLEISLTLSILALLAILGLPFFSLGAQTQAYFAAQSWKIALEYWQIYAAEHHQMVQLYPKEALALTPALLPALRPLSTAISVEYKGFQSPTHIDIRSNGTLVSNGHLTIFYHQKAYYQVIFNQAGRVRIEKSTEIS
jgi:prepilin-type N-terminal cleavage/methylation domain-containing protein